MWSTGESVTEAVADREGDRAAAAAGFASAPKEAPRVILAAQYHPQQARIDFSLALFGPSVGVLLLTHIVPKSAWRFSRGI